MAGKHKLDYIVGKPGFLRGFARCVFNCGERDAPAALTDFQFGVVEYHYLLCHAECFCMAGGIFLDQSLFVLYV